MYVCQQAGGLTLQEIADTFGLARYGGAGSVITKLKAQLATDRTLARKVNRVLGELTG